MTEILDPPDAGLTQTPDTPSPIRFGANDFSDAPRAGAAADATTATVAPITAEASAPTQRMSTRAKLVLFILCAANFLVGIDFSILNIALPAIGSDLHLGEADLQRVATAFALPSGGFLLLFGRTGDMVGRRRVFLTGIAVFTFASLLAGLAWNPAVLLVARALQGLGAAGVVPTGMALLTTSFAEGRARDRALGIAGSVMAIGFTAGNLVGGVLTSMLSWRYTMVIPVALGVVVLVGAPLLVPESRNEHRSKLDVPGAVTVTGGLLALIYALTTAAQQGWTRPNVLGTLVGGVLLLAAFLAVETRSAHPLVSLTVLRRRSVALGNLGGLTTFGTASALTFISMLFLQQVDGLSALRAGLVFGWVGAVSAVSGNVAPRMIGRFGSRRVLVAALLVQGLGSVPIALMNHGDSVLILLVAGTFWAYGHLHAVVGYNVTATSGLSNEEQGLATGLSTTTQQVALTVGIPILSAIASARQGVLRRSGQSAEAALVGGFHLALVVCAATTLLGAVLLGFGLLRSPRARG